MRKLRLSRLVLALAVAALGGGAATLTHARPALASDPPSPSSTDETLLLCGQGHRYVCYVNVTYKCVDWSYGPNGAPECAQYTTVTEYVYRD